MRKTVFVPSTCSGMRLANPLEKFFLCGCMQGMLQVLVPPPAAALEALVVPSAEVVRVAVPQSHPVAAMGLAPAAVLEGLAAEVLKMLVLPVLQLFSGGNPAMVPGSASGVCSFPSSPLQKPAANS